MSLDHHSLDHHYCLVKYASRSEVCALEYGLISSDLFIRKVGSCWPWLELNNVLRLHSHHMVPFTEEYSFCLLNPTKFGDSNHNGIFKNISWCQELWDKKRNSLKGNSLGASSKGPASPRCLLFIANVKILHTPWMCSWPQLDQFMVMTKIA